ncbi:hypothetical protein [Formosa algae]|uniref:hypothetical protein n=1 Tax=Formosa algae TaxID=225843 RepID=UPI000CCEB41F|nr:hypothetical protein [Formosa algae]PNW29763.1 hypothetical protein BKP44_03480 [Formosa algae]
MRKTSVISALILAVVATILATLPASLYATIVALVAILLGVLGWRLSTDKLQAKSTSQLAILLSTIALILSVYKYIFIPVDIKESTPTEQHQEEDDFDDDADYDDSLDNDLEEVEEKPPLNLINANSPIN